MKQLGKIILNEERKLLPLPALFGTEEPAEAFLPPLNPSRLHQTPRYCSNKSYKPVVSLKFH